MATSTAPISGRLRAMFIKTCCISRLSPAEQRDHPTE